MSTYNTIPRMGSFQPPRPQYTCYNPNSVRTPLYQPQLPVSIPPTGYRVQSDNRIYRPQQYNQPIQSYHTYNAMSSLPFQNNPQLCQPPAVPPRLLKPFQTEINQLRPTYVLESPKENVPNQFCQPPSRIDFPREKLRYSNSNPNSNWSLEDDHHITRIHDAPFTREHELTDIPELTAIPVKQLSSEIFRHICTRLDNMSPTGETRNVIDLATRTGYPIRSISNTESLLRMWNPNLSELIEKLQEMECKQLVSEIIEKLKNKPFQTFQPQNDIYSRNMSVSKYATNLSNSFERLETLPIPIRSISKSDSKHSSPSSSFSSSPRSLSPELFEKREIYVSYHQDDAEIGEEIVRKVREFGLTVACNDDILPGSSELEGANKFLMNCKRVIGVITDKYVEDDAIPKYEGLAGIHKSPTGKKRTFIPIQVERTDNLPTYFANIKPIKWSSGNKWELLKLSLTK